MRRKSRIPGRARGFTLIELAIVCALSIAGFAAAARLFTSLLDLHAAQAERMDLMGMGRIAAERMTAELHLASSFVLAAATAVEFTADLGSGDTAVRYSLYDPGDDGLPPIYLYRAEGTTAPPAGQALAILLDASVGPGVPAAPATPRFELRYHDSTGAALATPVGPADLARIRLVGVTMTLENVEDDPSAAVPHAAVALRWAVAPWNMEGH